MPASLAISLDAFPSKVSWMESVQAREERRKFSARVVASARFTPQRRFQVGKTTGMAFHSKRSTTYLRVPYPSMNIRPLSQFADPRANSGAMD